MNTQNNDVKSDDKSQRLNNLIKRQEGLLDEMKQELCELDSAGLIAENERLKRDVSNLNDENKRLSEDNERLSKSLDGAKAALFKKMTNEKLSAFSRTQSQIDSYYYRENASLNSRLDEYKENCIGNINLMRDKINQLADSRFEEISKRLAELEAEFNLKYDEVMKARASERDKADEANAAWRKKTEHEPLTDAEKKTAEKQKSFETFVGLNIMSKAGIVLFLIGIIALGRFAYTRLSDVFKAIMIYILGAGLICIGEVFHKKEKTVFSTALISGGASVLYAGVATSYFALDLFSIETAFILCVVVTAITISLSLQLKSQVVCAFGAVGGYLPLVATYMIGFGSAAADKTFLPVSAVYFCLLAVIIFAMTYNKRWYAAQFIGYGFQMLAVVGVSRCAWALSRVVGHGYALPLAIVFSAVSFVIYMMMPTSKIITKKGVTSTDCVLLALNTATGAISININMYNCISSKRAVGFTFLAFTAVYALLAGRMNLNSEKSSVNTGTKIVLMLGTLVFSMFVAPMIFGAEYIGIAWAAQGVLIAAASMKMKSKLPEFAGLLTMILSQFFMLLDADKKLVIVSLTVIIAAFWAYIVIGHMQENKKPMRIFYSVAAMIVGIGTVAYADEMYSAVTSLPSVVYTASFARTAVLIAVALLVGVFSYTGALKNKINLIYSVVVRAVSFAVTALILNCIENYSMIYDCFGNQADIKNAAIINAVIVVAINVGALIVLAHGTSRLIAEFELPAWVYAAVISAGSLILITSLLMGQFGVKFTNVLISAIYIALACVLLVIGFKKRYTVVRSGGLVLILCALAKLCFADTRSLDTIWKIGAYFAFGAVLIAISYFYQRFSKKLEEQATEQISAPTEKAE